MTASPRWRRALLALHLACSVGWVGAVCAYLVLAFAVPPTADPAMIRAAWLGMDLIGWFALVPLALSSLGTGLLLAGMTRWGLLRHYWVLISLVATTALTAVLVLHMPGVSAQADLARIADAAELTAMGSDIPHALIGLAFLLGILVLNIYKPAGLTRYGWRKEQAERVRSASQPRGTRT